MGGLVTIISHLRNEWSFQKPLSNLNLTYSKRKETFLRIELFRNREQMGQSMTNTATLDILAICAAFAMVTAVIVGAW